MGYEWLENDLKSIDRDVTPWVVFGGHRSVYVNSNDCCEHPKPGVPIPGPNNNVMEACGDGCIYGSDRQAMLMMQDYIEDLLYKYRVNLAFAGHIHWIQRQSAVYKNKIIQAADIVPNEHLELDFTHSVVTEYEGNVALHHNPQATVYTVIGTGGQGFQYRPSSPRPPWSELLMEEFGYAIVTAANRTCLVWELINNVDNTILDKIVITQPPSFPPSFGMDQNLYEMEKRANNVVYIVKRVIWVLGVAAFAIIYWIWISVGRKYAPFDIGNPNASGGIGYKNNYPVQYHHHPDELIPLAMNLRKVRVNRS